MSRDERTGLLSRPGGLLLHPVALVALALLWQNDHRWKWQHPGWITGKLSDLCGLVVFPLLLAGLIELVWFLRGRPKRLGPRAVLYAALATGVVFAAIKVNDAAADAYRFLFGVRWLIERALLHGDTTLPHVRHVADPTDLLALPALLLPVLIARRRGAPPVSGEAEPPALASSCAGQIPS
jgi:preprotein translocase subunit Sec61beta